MYPQLIEGEIPCKARVELSGRMLVKLLSSGVLHSADCKSLDANAKQIIWQALLISCSQNRDESRKENNLCA